MENKSKSIAEYNILRVIAVLLVVISHCTYYKITSDYGGIDYSKLGIQSISFLDEITAKLLSGMTSILYTFHMPLFIALSGALFNNSIKRGKIKNIKDLATQKAKRLLIPFIVVLVTFAVPIKYVSGYFAGSQNVMKDIFLGQVLIQGNTHLWFLPTLFFEFLILYYLVTRKKFKERSILLLIIFSILNIFSSYIKIEILKDICMYLIYFYIGYLFENYREKINGIIQKKSINNISCQILGILILLVIYNIFNFSGNIFVNTIFRILKLAMGIMGSYMIYLISYKLSKTKLEESKIIRKINENSFGLYLYSDPINYLILFITYNVYGIEVFYTNPGIIVIFIVRVIITFAIAYLITDILRKLKVKYVC